ncbi:MAG: hypothetical protein KDI33_12130 [Halioglobus sp.]|nr:hypothetical protein [Halioglobus sp.]
MNNKKLLELSRLQLAQLGREYMLCAQFNSRTGYAALRINHGDEAYKEVAIANWMGASPVYTRRMQRAMGFAGGTDVATIFKGLQLECGFTHQYFDVHFEVTAEDRGRFWLNSCGALLETEPRGDDAVRVMCHDIEDPTFNATAVATNARARMVPVHRPPRAPADRVPHCEWTVSIDPLADAVPEPDIARVMSGTQLANVVIERPQSDGSGGLDDYAGPLFEQLQLEQLSHAALVVVCSELAVQVHLLITGLLYSVAQRYGDAAARAVGEFQMTGSCWVMSHRLGEWLGCRDTGIDGILAVLEVHPAFQPCEYWSIEVTRLSGQRARLALVDCPATGEAMPYGWCALLASGMSGGLDGLVKGVDHRARIVASEGDALAWEIIVDESAEAREEPLAVQVAKGTVLYQTRLEDHIQLLQLAANADTHEG